jgi:hypothetical protein
MSKESKETAKFDKELTEKIRRVEKSSEDVVKHITERNR